MGEVINFQEARRDIWLRRLEAAREAGQAIVWGAIGQQEAIVIPFPETNKCNGQ